MSVKGWRKLYDNCIDDNAVAQLCQKLGILPTTAKLLWQRGYKTPENAASFICKEDSIFHDPYLMKDMEKACQRIMLARDRNEKVMIYGDYDVDGVTSVAVLYLYLSSLGLQVDYHIPGRLSEGYGINRGAVDKIVEDGYTLMITVDTGITADAEISYSLEKGLETVVTDHHECHGDIPKNACAVVNPKRPDCTYPFEELAGVGVVFKLIFALEIKRVGDINTAMRNVFNEYSDLVAIGTIADVMPLNDENRLIVSAGLKKLELDTRVGLQALLCSGSANQPRPKRITSSTVGFALAPKLNAAGRLSDASIACSLLLSKSEDEALRLADELCNINTDRRSEENVITAEAIAMMEEGYDFEKYPVIVLAKENWHHGVIGIVASRITDKYGLPAILVSFDENGVGKGSGRSIKGLNLVDALSYCEDLLEKYGGHELAAGLTVTKENLDSFREKINEYAKKEFRITEDSEYIGVDLELGENDITVEQAEELYLLEPYGTANPSPLFVMKDACVESVMGIGADKHTRFNLSKNGHSFCGVYFGNSPRECGVSGGDKADFVFNLEINEFRDRKNPQLNIKRIFPPQSLVHSRGEEIELYNKIKCGMIIPANTDIVPKRSDFATLYTYIDRNVKKNVEIYPLSVLEAACSYEGTGQSVKLRFMLDIFSEMGLLSVEAVDGGADESYRIKPKFVRGKVNLDKSAILRELRSKQEKI